MFDASTAPNGWYAFGDLAKTTVDETFDANLTVSGHTHLTAFSETVVALGSQSGDLATLPAFNASNASIYTVTATGGITINSIPNAVAGSSYTIKVTQDGTGSHVLSSTFKYQGGNKTFEMMIERNCPKQYKCIYNPNGEEPDIDKVMESLRSIAK